MPLLASRPNILPPSAETTACKICAADAHFIGVVDFHKSCEDRRRIPLPLSGIPIYYHQCHNCGFIFTTALDHFTHEDFAAHIYNEQYIRFDPDYRELRPRANSQFIRKLFPNTSDLRILDYGGGSGSTAQYLRELGFNNVTVYDPFSPQFNSRPQGTFDLILCFEVLEHAPFPRQTIQDIRTFLRDPGLILLSTLLQPADIILTKLNWWYAAPRNGHISLFSAPSLNALLAPEKLRVASVNQDLHLLFQNIPAWANHLFSAPPAKPQKSEIKWSNFPASQTLVTAQQPAYS